MGERAIVQAAAEMRPEEAEEEPELGLFAEPETEQGQAKLAHIKRGPGRPPGARNKRSERVLAWIKAHHKDPLEGLLAIGDMHPADLAAMAGCTIFEALQEQRLCRQAALPFTHQRQPLALDVTNRSIVYLNIDTAGQVTPAEDAGIGLAARLVEHVEYQEVSGDEPGEVGQSELDNAKQAVDPAG